MELFDAVGIAYFRLLVRACVVLESVTDVIVIQPELSPRLGKRPKLLADVTCNNGTAGTEGSINFVEHVIKINHNSSNDC